MPANNLRTALALAAALTLAATAADATVLRAVKFDDKVENATSIVLGRCVAQQARWDEAHKWILTYSTFEVEETLKGAPAQKVTIVTPGGVVDNVAQDVVGVPRFRQGEEHVVFVRDTRAGPTVAYFEQGAYRVVKDDRGERVVQPLVSTEVLVDTQRGTAVAPERPRTLRDFQDSVRDTIARRERMKMELIEKRKAEQASIWSQLQRNRLLVALAIAGVLLASWQYFRRS